MNNRGSGANDRIVEHNRAADLSRIGRTGELILDYILEGSKTILRHSSSRSPWHFFPPMALDETGAAYRLLVNPSGGLIGGDHLSLRAFLGPQSHVLFSTPSANRVYRSIAEPSRQDIHLTVGAGAILEWVPELTIPFSGSRFSQTLHVALESGGTLILWDALAAGRIARGDEGLLVLTMKSEWRPHRELRCWNGIVSPLRAQWLGLD